MSDIVKRLRAPAYWMSGSSEGHEGGNDAPRAAADEIDRLTARVKELEEGLSFYAAWPRTPSGNMAALLLDAGHKARALLTQSALKGVHTEHTPAPEKKWKLRTDARYNNAERIFGDD